MTARGANGYISSGQGELLHKLGYKLISSEEIETRVSELADKINKDYKNKKVLLVGILKGAVVFMADLMRYLEVDVDLDFIAISSYGSATKTSGVVRILKDLDEPIVKRHVLLVEDIADTGLTLSYLIKNLESRGPKSLNICSLLRKKDKQKRPINIKYVGFEIADDYVVGYGLDYNQQFRNLKDLFILETDEEY